MTGQEWIHCYVCGKTKLAKNITPHTITYGILEKDGTLTEKYTPVPDNPRHYAMGLCTECAPGEGKCPDCGEATHRGFCLPDE